MLSLDGPDWNLLRHAAAKGRPEIAEAALELASSEAASEFLEWKLSQ